MLLVGNPPKKYINKKILGGDKDYGEKAAESSMALQEASCELRAKHREGTKQQTIVVNRSSQRSSK